MKRILFQLLSLALLAVSCGPSRHAVHVEMRYPSKSGLELSGKTLSVVYLENDNPAANLFNEGMADGFAYALEQDYGTGEGSIGVYKMRCHQGARYASRDSLLNLLIDTGSDVVFLLDTLQLGTMKCFLWFVKIYFKILLELKIRILLVQDYLCLIIVIY